MAIDEKRIVDHIVKAPVPVALSELLKQFRIRPADKREFRNLLRQLERAGRIMRVRGKSYAAPSGKSGRIVGRLQVTARGFGFVRPDWSTLVGERPFEGDLYIGERSMGTALDGDLVRAELLRKGEQGPSGRVEEVIEHAHKRIVGWYQRTPKGGEVFPRNKRIDRRIYVPAPDKNLGIGEFDWVEVEVDEFTPAPDPLIGHVVGRIGSDDDRGIDVLLVLRDKGIVEEFSPVVEEEVAKLDFDWTSDLEGRTDYRKLPTVTIDPKTAKDYDDALSIEQLPGGVRRLYVHIADVAHFVRRGTAVDREALDRSTSVYPVDRVVPMLPHRLSSNLCSLLPHQDRLTVTAVMEIGADGSLKHSEFHSSVIHSDFRLTYEQAQAVYAGDRSESAPFEHLIPMLEELRELAAILRRARMKRGALDLDIPESTIIFDEKGSVSDIRFYPRFESHQVVEECMLIANEAVAQHLTRKEAPLLYRIHEVADQEKLERLGPALKLFGIRLYGRSDEITPFDIQAALEQAQQHPAGHILRRLILRALKRAEYDPENVGHFGLASECYCHFTSPIRRYPDVIVHRQLKALETKKGLAYPADDNELDALGEHTSDRERRAQDAEWEARTIKGLEFMKKLEGEEMDGFISSVQSWGLFIEIAQYPVEGLVKVASLRNDRYDLDENGVRLIGRNTGHVLKLGDKIRVRIDKVDPFGQMLDLTLLDQPAFKKFRGRGPAPRKATAPKPKGKPRKGR